MMLLKAFAQQQTRLGCSGLKPHHRLVLFQPHVVSYSSSLSESSERYVESLYKGVVANKRAELARSITLIETTNNEKKLLAQSLLNKVLHKLKHDKEKRQKICLRIGRI